MQPLSVSALTHQIKSLLETSFSRVMVEGELSRITYHNSGHIYFTLKDEAATIRCVMFRGNASRLKFRLEEGLKVMIDAALTLYTPRGEYQLNCFSIEPSGKGALAYAFEQLKEKLAQKGYFDPARKKQLPRFPKKVALITSATGAALQDMLRVAKSRYGLVKFDLYDVVVQGETAAAAIAAAIELADKGSYDAIILARGGGSIEDLWPFNEEIVATAIFRAKTPIISAIGHEIDTLISDFVADIRAATPSNAIELLLPDKNELLIYIDTLQTQFSRTIEQKFQKEQQLLEHLYNAFAQHSIEKKLSQKIEYIRQLQDNFEQSIRFKIEKNSSLLQAVKNEFPQTIQNLLTRKSDALIALSKAFEANNPKQRTKRGFAQIVKGDKIVNLDELDIHQEFEAQNYDTIITAKVLQKRKTI